jgi:hypothetical protein
MGKVRHRVALHPEVDGHGRAAKLGMSGRGRIRGVQSANSGNCARQFENPAVVDVIQHGFRPDSGKYA